MTATPSAEALEPCPWCGRPVSVRYERRYVGPDTYSISCGFVSCGVNPSTGEHADEADAIAAWNRRPASPSREEIRREAFEEAAKVAKDFGERERREIREARERLGVSTDSGSYSAAYEAAVFATAEHLAVAIRALSPRSIEGQPNHEPVEAE